MSYRKALKDAECFLEQAGVPDAGIDPGRNGTDNF